MRAGGAIGLPLCRRPFRGPASFCLVDQFSGTRSRSRSFSSISHRSAGSSKARLSSGATICCASRLHSSACFLYSAAARITSRPGRVSPFVQNCDASRYSQTCCNHVTAIRRLKTDFDESFCCAKTKAPTEAGASKEGEAVGTGGNDRAQHRALSRLGWHTPPLAVRTL